MFPGSSRRRIWLIASAGLLLSALLGGGALAWRRHVLDLRVERALAALAGDRTEWLDEGLLAAIGSGAAGFRSSQDSAEVATQLRELAACLSMAMLCGARFRLEMG